MLLFFYGVCGMLLLSIGKDRSVGVFDDVIEDGDDVIMYPA